MFKHSALNIVHGYTRLRNILNMVVVLVLSFALFSSLSFNNSFADSAGTSRSSDGDKYGVIDISKIFLGSKAYKDIMKQIEEKKNEYQSMIQKHETILRRKNELLEKKRDKMPQNARNNATKELREEGAKLQREATEKGNLIRDNMQAAEVALMNRITAITSKIADEKNIVFVARKELFVTYDAKRFDDLSEAVLAVLDKEMPSYNMDSPNEDKKNDEKKKSN